MKAMEAKDLIGRKVLITVDNWFFAPDGRQYRAVQGTLVATQQSEQALGIKVSAKSQDWYMTVGNMKIAGCQIHYAILADKVHDGPVWDYTTSGNEGFKSYERPTCIYFADPPDMAVLA